MLEQLSPPLVVQGDEAVKEAILRKFVDFFQHEGIAHPLNFAYIDWLSEQAGLACKAAALNWLLRGVCNALPPGLWACAECSSFRPGVGARRQAR